MAFALGFACSNIYAEFHNSSQLKEQPADNIANSVSDDNKLSTNPQLLTSFFLAGSQDKASPYDWIKEDQIHVYDDRIVIDLKDAEWATFTDTNSMDPVIDSDSNAIEIVPESPQNIHVGDIVSYQSKYAPGTVIHRVVEVGNDEEGWYCRLKGDNLEENDPGKVRFNQIKRVVVGIIY